MLILVNSNPESYNAWSSSLGLDTSLYSFQDCYGLDPEVLSWVAQPVKAVLLLFPITKEYEIMRKKEDLEIEENGVEGVADVIYFKQTSKLQPFTDYLIRAWEER